MASSINDVNGDGRPDIFVTNIWFTDEMTERMRLGSLDYNHDGNNLLINRGAGEFTDEAAEYGIRRGGWGWASVLEDLDNDGDLDLFHTTANYKFDGRTAFSPEEAQELIDQYSFYTYPVLYSGGDAGFEPVNISTAGFQENDGRGVAALDATGSGELDLLIGNTADNFTLYEQTGGSGNSLIIDVERGPDTSAFGATVTVETANRTYHRWVTADVSYLSQSDPAVHVGVGGSLEATVTVTWPNGEERTFENLATNHRYRVDPSGVIDRRSFD
ncbi:MAG: ASPIC/UnbV domain-containing protein [Natrialbaceae archaeon]|nr:ASPIC/UnbV domain-containing protein [Natrialbaceae archaeon]